MKSFKSMFEKAKEVSDKEYEKIFKSTDSPANRTRIANILLELRRLRDEFAK